jgi:hypothetical protein
LSEEWTNLLKNKKITHIKTAVYHPESDILVEPTFKSMIQRTRCMGAVHSKQRDEIFKNVRALTNKITNKATGYSLSNILSRKVQRTEVQENLD